MLTSPPGRDAYLLRFAVSVVSATLTAMRGFNIEPDCRAVGFPLCIRARLCALVLMLMTAMAPAHAGPMLTLEAGLAQSAGVEFFADPTALSVRIEASSSNRLTSILITVNGQDLTKRLVTLGRLSVAPEGTSGSLVAERLSLLALGVTAAGTYRVAATVSDSSGPTTIEATLSSGGVAAAVAFTTLAQGTSSANRGTMRTVIRQSLQHGLSALGKTETFHLPNETSLSEAHLRQQCGHGRLIPSKIWPVR